ncbi:MAG TPA: PEP-CTERM sorting domain-containing protein [Phycisphaeraceae bacterium]
MALTLAGCAAAALTVSASAALIDASDPWYTTADATVTRASTTPGDAIDLTVDNGSDRERIAANFDTFQLDDEGDQLSLEFDLTLSNLSGTGGFRLGLFHNGGTPITANSTGGVLQNTTDDAGYFIELGVGAAGAAAYRETPEANGILAGPINVTLGVGGGAGFAGFNDTDPHEVSLLLTRLANSIHLLVKIDGGTAIYVSDTADGYVTEFNLVAFGMSGSAVYDYELGNVRVNASPVPEPASLMLLLGLGGLGFLRRRRHG